VTGNASGTATGTRRIDDLTVDVTVRRVRRMNVRVHPPDGSVRLSVPPRTSWRTVTAFVRASRPWIDRHRQRIVEEAQHAAQADPPPTGRTGEVWWHLGRAHRIRREGPGGPLRVRLAPRRIVVAGADGEVEDAAVLAALDRWERRRLRALADPLLDGWAARMGVRHEFLGLRRMTTRWGSCVPARRRIWLNTLLVRRPPALLEYVVVHELAHLRESSHGPRFQALMDEHLPDWRERRRRLDRT